MNCHTEAPTQLTEPKQNTLHSNVHSATFSDYSARKVIPRSRFPLAGPEIPSQDFCEGWYLICLPTVRPENSMQSLGHRDL